jgi:cellulose biosynthesis protein BcsQ
MPARLISVINMKGGVGKSTTTVSLAETLAHHQRRRVLIIDLDPQTNATSRASRMWRSAPRRRNSALSNAT